MIKRGTGDPLTSKDLEEAIETIKRQSDEYYGKGTAMTRAPNLFVDYGKWRPSFSGNEDPTGSFVSIPKGEYQLLLSRVATLESKLFTLEPQLISVTARVNQQDIELDMLREMEKDILPKLQELHDRLDEYLLDSIERIYP